VQQEPETPFKEKLVSGNCSPASTSFGGSTTSADDLSGTFLAQNTRLGRLGAAITALLSA
jgi:hypothetical protein